MAKHKVFASMRGFSMGHTGQQTHTSSRRKLDAIQFDLNADCNGKTNVSGGISMHHDGNTDEVTIVIDCPHYNIKVVGRRPSGDLTNILYKEEVT